jgi:hypothetical protein
MIIVLTLRVSLFSTASSLKKKFKIKIINEYYRKKITKYKKEEFNNHF